MSGDSQAAERRLVSSWMVSSAELFRAIRSEYELPPHWTFDISTADLLGEELFDIRGAAAFALRRIQVIRMLLESETPLVRLGSARLSRLASYLLDLVQFMDLIEGRFRAESPTLYDELLPRVRTHSMNLMRWVGNQELG